MPTDPTLLTKLITEGSLTALVVAVVLYVVVRLVPRTLDSFERLAKQYTDSLATEREAFRAELRSFHAHIQGLTTQIQLLNKEITSNRVS